MADNGRLNGFALTFHVHPPRRGWEAFVAIAFGRAADFSSVVRIGETCERLFKQNILTGDRRGHVFSRQPAIKGEKGSFQ
jgi:hypothetical protein